MDPSSGYTLVANFFSALPTDWIIIGAFAIFAAFDTLRSGARRACTVALAFPVTTFVITLIPQTIILGPVVADAASPYLGTIVFGVVFVVLYVLIGRFDFAWGDDAGMTIQAAIAGVATAAIVVTFWVATPALDALWHFGPQIQEIFAEGYRLWWIIGSYAALSFVRNS